MSSSITRHLPALLLLVPVLAASPAEAEAQGRPGGDAPQISAEVTFSVGDRERIRDYYASHARPDVEALPPGIRRRLERGKPLPPGIAKRTPPPDLQRQVTLPSEYEIVEVGLDVLLVEAATGIIHDVLMDVIR